MTISHSLYKLAWEQMSGVQFLKGEDMCRPWKYEGGVEVRLHSVLHSTLDGSEWSAASSGRFTSRYRARGTHFIGGWVGPRAGVNFVEQGKYLHRPCRDLNLRSSNSEEMRWNLSLHCWVKTCYWVPDSHIPNRRERRVSAGLGNTTEILIMTSFTTTPPMPSSGVLTAVATLTVL